MPAFKLAASAREGSNSDVDLERKSITLAELSIANVKTISQEQQVVPTAYGDQQVVPTAYGDQQVVPTAYATAYGDQQAVPIAHGDERQVVEATVLLVDDMQSILMFYTALLRKSGLAVTTARSGAEALELMYSQQFRAVFCDICMPEMDGTECIKTFRKWELENREDRQAVYALTASTEASDQEFYLECGFDAICGKNVKKEELLSYIYSAGNCD
eukprot:CAMPEP_0197865124 /NCGR_PEP_ID=MMETSP1438-20131217/43482_1 /TAXON_ID=1461541 /ORGANISM="Pterosperma sp., Strain CCMP1384" /LENGTH=215 /DNA_ID=CAMNT_0043483537 /DNA_START=353 /DNA_END=1000 /DNA_ORIENTATION=+